MSDLETSRRTRSGGQPEEQGRAEGRGTEPARHDEALQEEAVRRAAVEQALQEERDFANAVLDTVGALVIVLDLDGRIVRFNRACENLTGYAFSEVQGRPFWDFLLLPEEAGHVKSTFHQLLTGQFPNSFENYWVARDGGRKLIAWTNTAVLDPQGQVVHIIGTGIDITERRQAEEALRQSEEKFRQLFNSLPVGISLLDEQRRVVDTNPAMERALRMPREAILTGAYTKRRYIRPDGSPLPAEEMPSAKAFQEGGIVQDVEIGIVEGEGAPFWVSVGASLLSASGASVAVTAVDVTARKQAEEALRVALAKYSVLFESFPLGVTVSDRAGQIVEVNRESERLLGTSQAEQAQRGLTSPSWQIIRLDGSPMPSEEFASVRALRENRLIENVEMGIVKDGGSVTWLNVTAAPIPLEGYGVAVTYGDISAQKRAEQALRESEERLRSLYASMTEGVALHRVEYDAQGRPTGYTILDVNPAFERITGLSREQVLGQQATSAYHADRAPYLEVYAQVAASGEPATFETYFAPMGKHFRVSAFSPRRGQFATVFEDISLQKQNEEILEQRVRERTAELAQANARLQREAHERERAEAAVRAERERFNDVLETLPAYVVLLTPDYHATFANRVFRERFGESYGRPCYEFLFQRGGPCDNCETYRVLQTGSTHHWEWTGPDGRNYDVYDYPFTDTDGSPLILEMGLDITERKRAEQALKELNESLERHVAERTAELRETRDYLDNLLTYANAPIIVWDPLFRITRFNGAFERLTGLAADQAIGRPLDILFPEGRKEEAMGYIRRTVAGERWDVVEIPIQHVDGTVRTVLWNSATLYAADGTTLLATIGQGQDITERKQTEETLRASEERSARAQEIAHLGSWELDLANYQLTWSDEVYRIFGVQPQEFGATYEAFLAHVHPDDRAAVSAAFANSLRDDNDGYEIEHRIIRGTTGEIRFIYEKCQHLRDAAGEITHSIGMVHDLTERKQAEEALEQRNRDLRLLNRLSQELGTIHELPQLLDRVSQAVREVLPADGSIIWLWDEQQPDRLICRARSYPGENACPPDMYLQLGEGLAGWVAERGLSAVVACARDDARCSSLAEIEADFRAGAVLATPMQVSNSILGALEVVSRKPGALDAEDLVLVETLAAATAIAIENIHLHEQAQQAAVLAERGRLARELHDAVSQTLFSASVIAEALPRLWERKPERVRQGLEQLQQLTRGALSEMRTLLLELRPASLTEGQMGDLLQQLVDAFASRSRVAVSLVVRSQRPLPEKPKIALYRITQEALNNVAKHARATRVEIDLHDRGPQIELRIRDNGRGFDPRQVPPDRLGLGILRERAEAIDAVLTVASRPGKGTEISVVWPAHQGGNDV